jgi:hypothetical protein
MQEAKRTRSIRAAALAMAICVNGLFILLLVSGRTNKNRELEVTAMIWIAAELEQSRPAARRAVTPRRAVRGALPAVVTAPSSLTTLVEPMPSPTGESPAATPSIDWYAEAGKAALSVVKQIEPSGQGISEDPDPPIQVRPESNWIPPKKGAVEQLPGGGSRVWTSDLCYREYNPLEPDPFTGRYRQGGRTVCKPRTLDQRQSEARAEAIADAVRRKRSPTPPQTGPDAPRSGLQVP